MLEITVEAALRAAVADYAAHTAAPAAGGTHQDGWARFNWGDALSEIPAAIFARHGLRVLDTLLPTVTVEQNELLLPAAGDRIV